MKTSTCLLIVLGLAACQDSSRPTDNTQSNTLSAPSLPATAEGPQCYTRITGKDTAFLELNIQGDSVRGKLAYRNFEKDSSEGTVRGTRQGNFIDVQYTFNSEGMTSVRRIIFKQTDDRVYEGLANAFDKEGNPLYDSDRNKIRFDQAAFTPGDCR